MRSFLCPQCAHYRLLLLLLGNLALLLAFAAVIWFDNAFNRGITYTPDPTPIAWADGPQVGVNVYNLHLEPDPAVVTRTLELVRDMGARYVRMQIPWEDIEIHGRGDFMDRRNVEAVGVISAWDKYDHIVDTANCLDLELVMRVDRAPMWASTFFKSLPTFQEGLAIDHTSTGPPDDFNDYLNFLRILIDRYRGRVRFFQIWNEPNLLNEWNWQTPNPRDFAALQCLSYYTAKDTNPDAIILFPSLAPTDGLDKRAPLTDLEFLDQFYREGGKDCFDIMSAQAYGLGQPPDEHRYVRLRNLGNWNWTRPIDTRTDVSRIVLLREVMELHGDGDKAIWIGESGWNSAPDHIPAERRYTWGRPVSEQQKGEYIIGQIERARREWPWVGVLHVWMLRHGGYLEPDPEDPTPYFALVQRDWTLLPAYFALQDYLAQPDVAGVGAHTWQHPAVEPIPGGWRVRFRGNHIALIDGLSGNLERVSLDGVPTTLSRDTTPDGTPRLSLGGMPDRLHLLEIIAPQADPPTHFVVSRNPPLPWFWTLAPVVLIGALLISSAATMHTLFIVLDDLVARSPPGRNGLANWLVTPRAERLLLLGMLLGIIVFYRASPALPLTMAGLALFGGLALLRPDLALLYVPLTVPFFFIPKGIWDTRFGIRPEGLEFPLHEIVLLVVVGATLVRMLTQAVLLLNTNLIAASLRRLVAARRISRVAPILLFLLAGTLGLIIVPAEGRRVALREWRWLIVEPLLFYALLRYYADRQPLRCRQAEEGGVPLVQRLVAAFLLGGALVGLIGILQFLGLNLVPLIGVKAGFSADRILVEGVQRVSSVYGHPNHLGLFMGRVWPLAAALLLATRTARPTAPVGRSWTILLTLGVVFTLGGLIVSFSKGALLGAVGAAGVLAWYWLPTGALPTRWQRGWLLGGSAALVLVVLLIGVGLSSERFNPLGATSDIRLKTWASALAMIRDHPLLGIGLDQFGRLYPSYIHPTLVNTNEINTSHPHNLLLDIWLRTGILGLIAFGWLVGRFASSARRVPHSQVRTAPSASALQIGLLAAMTAALLHGLVDHFYFQPDLAFAFWLMVGGVINQGARPSC